MSGKAPKYKRVLLKLSGEALRGGQVAGIDPEAVQSICEQIKTVHDSGVEIALVVGGGNILRGAEAEKLGMNRDAADYMGMLATMINGLAIQDGLETMGLETRMLSAIYAWEEVNPDVSTRKIDGGDFNGAVLVTDLGGGMWNYEYALHNQVSERSAQAVRIDLPHGATITNVGFHDVEYHSGEPFDGTDWEVTIEDGVGPNSITWSTESFSMACEMIFLASRSASPRARSRTSRTC